MSQILITLILALNSCPERPWYWQQSSPYPWPIQLRGKNVSPVFFIFLWSPGVPWGMLLSYVLSSTHSPVEQCSSLLDTQFVIICWPLSRTLAIWNTLYLMIIWDVRCGQPRSGSTVSTTYTWCAFPIAMRHSPWSISPAPWVLLWLMNSTCQRACWVKGREGAMFPATEKNWLAQMGLKSLTLASLALSTTSHSHMTARAPAKCRNPVSIQKGKYKPQQHDDTHTETDLLANQEGNELEIYVPFWFPRHLLGERVTFTLLLTGLPS